MSFTTVKAWERPMTIWWPRTLWVTDTRHFWNEVNCMTSGQG